MCFDDDDLWCLCFDDDFFFFFGVNSGGSFATSLATATMTAATVDATDVSPVHLLKCVLDSLAFGITNPIFVNATSDDER